VTRVWAEWPGSLTRSVLGTTQPHIHRLGEDCYWRGWNWHPPSSADSNYKQSYTSTAPYTFMACTGTALLYVTLLFVLDSMWNTSDINCCHIRIHFEEWKQIHVDNKIWGNLRKMGSLVKMFETWSWRVRFHLTDAAHLSNDISHSATIGIPSSSCMICIKRFQNKCQKSVTKHPIYYFCL